MLKKFVDYIAYFFNNHEANITCYKMQILLMPEQVTISVTTANKQVNMHILTYELHIK